MNAEDVLKLIKEQYLDKKLEDIDLKIDANLYNGTHGSLIGLLETKKEIKKLIKLIGE